MALANMTQAETDRENREHCKHIAEELEKYANGEIYRCPECGEAIEWNNDQYNSEEASYTCSHCDATFEESELEALSLWDYLSDALDFRFLMASDKSVIAVKICVAFGGPNIWIDTESQSVELYWWTDRASYPISRAVCDALDEWAEEYWGCM